MKYQGITMQVKDKLTITERVELHKANHPNDDGVRKVFGITWGNTGKRTVALNKFYKNHIYTFVDKDMNKAWIRIAGFDGGEEE